MKIIENTCGLVCPVVSELKSQIDDLKAENAGLNLRINRLVSSKRESEKRIAKIRQAAFGVVDWGIDVE